MRKFVPLAGRWLLQFEYDANGGSPAHKNEGRVVFRPGPGGRSLVQDSVEEIGVGRTTAVHSVIWWDEKAHGYRAIRCESEQPEGCRIVANLGKWEGDQFVLSDEFTKDGKKYVSKEVLSEITTNSFTNTVSQGEAGKELKRVVTIHGASVAVAPQRAMTPTPKPK